MADKRVRFAVGSPTGPQSPTYGLYYDPSGADVYVVSRAIGRDIKASLHASGNCRVAYTVEHMRSIDPLIQPGMDRAVVKWTRPKPFDSGLTRMFQMIVPRSAVTTVNAKLENPNRVVWTPAPPEGMAVYLDVIYSAPDWSADEWPGKEAAGSTRVFNGPLGTGERIWLVAYERQFDERDWVEHFGIQTQPPTTKTMTFAINKIYKCGILLEHPIPRDQP